MGLITVTIAGVELDVYYECSAEKDSYGTGDSPTTYDIDITSIEVGSDTQDIQDLLGNVSMEKIFDAILEEEAE